MDGPFAPTPEPWSSQTPSPPPDLSNLLSIAQQLRCKVVASRRSTPSLQSVPEYTEMISGRVIELARSGQGCRTLQREINAMRECHRVRDLASLASELMYSSGIFKHVIDDKFANYVVQDLVRALPGDHPVIDAITDAILNYPADVLATSQHGSHVIVAVLSQSLSQSGTQKKRGETLLHALTQRAASLAKDFHGSQVICFALGSMASSKVLLAPLAVRALDLCLNRHGHKVIQSALTRASSQALGQFEACLRENLPTLLSHEYGAKVVQHVLAKQRMGLNSITHAQAPLYCSQLANERDDKCLIALANDPVASTLLFQIMELSYNRKQLLDRLFMSSIDVKQIIQSDQGFDLINKVLSRFMEQRLN